MSSRGAPAARSFMYGTLSGKYRKLSARNAPIVARDKATNTLLAPSGLRGRSGSRLQERRGGHTQSKLFAEILTGGPKSRTSIDGDMLGCANGGFRRPLITFSHLQDSLR